MNQNPISPSESDRKTIEKRRRNEMKALYFKLCSLLPHQSSKEIGSMSDQLGEAASYIMKLQERLEVMKQKRNSLQVKKCRNLISSGGGGVNEPPVVEVHAKGSSVDVVLVTGVEQQYMLKETIRILSEEGADVVTAGFSVIDRTVFHTVYSEIRGSGFKNEGARISERLRKFVADQY